MTTTARPRIPRVPRVPRAPKPSNDEEPTPDAMDRLWAALDAALDPDPRLEPASILRAGTHYCKRCGYQWTPQVVHPRCCALCRSAYWDREPQHRRARRPGNTDWEEERQRRLQNSDERRHYRRIAKVKALAKELGFDITDPRTGKVISRRVVKAAAPVAPAPTVPTLVTTVEESPSPIPPLAFRRTVPPPPGIDDVDSRKG